VGFGEYGDQYIRLAFVENEQRIRQAARNIKKLLGSKGGTGNVVPLSGAV
jgi:alanine-synthesizing transaminase